MARLENVALRGSPALASGPAALKTRGQPEKDLLRVLRMP